MSILYIGRNEVIVDVPALAQVGEEMYVEGGRIAKGSIGRVLQILGQSGGRTRMRLQIIKGRILSARKVSGTPSESRGADPRAETEQPAVHPGVETASQRFYHRRQQVQEGGTAWFADRDPRPRRGPNSAVIENPYNFNPPPQVYQREERWAGGGSVVEIVPSGGVAAIIADPSLQPRGASSDYVPPSEFARGMGMDIDQGSAVQQQDSNTKGLRGSSYRDLWVAPEGNPTGPLVRVDGQMAGGVLREDVPQRALVDAHAIDPFNPSARPNLEVHRSYQQQQFESLRRTKQR